MFYPFHSIIADFLYLLQQWPIRKRLNEKIKWNYCFNKVKCLFLIESCDFYWLDGMKMGAKNWERKKTEVFSYMDSKKKTKKKENKVWAPWQKVFSPFLERKWEREGLRFKFITLLFNLFFIHFSLYFLISSFSFLLFSLFNQLKD